MPIFVKPFNNHSLIYYNPFIMKFLKLFFITIFVVSISTSLTAQINIGSETDPNSKYQSNTNRIPLAKNNKTTEFAYTDGIIYAFNVNFSSALDLHNYLVNVDIDDATMTGIEHSGISNVFAGDFIGHYLNRVLMGVSDKTLYSFNGDGSVFEIGDITGLPSSGFLTGLTWDDISQQKYISYHSSASKLYFLEDDLSTSYIGHIGEGLVIISISADSQGNIYGLCIETNSLYSINKETAEGTLVGPIGFGINFAQDIGFDKATDVLYGTLFSGGTSGALYTFDLNTGEATKIGENFQDELTMCAIYSTPDFYNVTFIVTDGENPIENVNINIEITGADIITNDEGVAATELPNGNYNYTVTIEGYEELSGVVTVADDDVSEDIVLNISINYYNVTFNVEGENGTIDAQVDGNAINSGSEVEEGKDVVFNTTPDAGYIVKEWILNEDVITGFSDLTYIVENLSEDITVTVEFQPNAYTVTFSVEGGNGSLLAEVDGEGINTGDVVEEGKNVVFTATPNAGYIIKEWTLNGSVIDDFNDFSYIYEDLNTEIDVVVEFQAITSVENLKEIKIDLYPNPATRKTIIVSETNIKEISVISVAGDIISNHKVNENQYYLNVESLSSGTYLIRIHTEKGVKIKRLQVY